jgi:hypothetical protein
MAVASARHPPFGYASRGVLRVRISNEILENFVTQGVIGKSIAASIHA